MATVYCDKRLLANSVVRTGNPTVLHIPVTLLHKPENVGNPPARTVRFAGGREGRVSTLTRSPLDRIDP